ncbi:MAG: caspase family protein [Bacteroidota bacterium]|nr:caspase family protein [Bacteroidota bacterium]
MKKVILLLILITQKLLSQEIIYNEDFSTNNNKWFSNETADYFIGISNEKYVMSSKNGNWYYSTKPINIDTKKDFTIEASVSKISGTDNYFYGLMIGASFKTPNPFYLCGITGNGECAFSKKDANNLPDLIHGTNLNCINKYNSKNELCLKKINNEYIFYINNTKVGSCPFDDFFDNHIGFVIFSGDKTLKVEFDDFKISYNTPKIESQIPFRKPESDEVKNNAAKTEINITGKNYALIIGNNAYQDPAISTLSEPINDATKLYNVLTTKYTFETQNVMLLKDASYVQMIEAFDKLSNKITPNDNLLVFYAGHGWWDETKNLGYWLPIDAKQSSTAFWIANSRISDYMSSINSKHTLLIADACFSGSIFKTRSAFADAQPAINKLYELPSKKAMTSGNLKEVPDKSMFLHFLVKKLTENNEKYLSSDVLFSSFRQAVLNNSPTEPQYGTIQNAGDEGGEFIFIKK